MLRPPFNFSPAASLHISSEYIPISTVCHHDTLCQISPLQFHSLFTGTHLQHLPQPLFFCLESELTLFNSPAAVQKKSGREKCTGLTLLIDRLLQCAKEVTGTLTQSPAVQFVQLLADIPIYCKYVKLVN